MRLKTQRRVVYAAMGLTVLALTGGFALAANFGVGGSNTSQQGSHSTTVEAVPGVMWTATQLGMGEGSGYSVCGGTNTSACDVTSTGAANCVGGIDNIGCANTDLVESVTLSTVVGTEFSGAAGGVPHTVNATLYIATTTGSYQSGTFFYSETAAPAATSTITLDYDISLTAGGAADVTSVTVVVLG